MDIDDGLKPSSIFTKTFRIGYWFGLAIHKRIPTHWNKEHPGNVQSKSVILPLECSRIFSS